MRYERTNWLARLGQLMDRYRVLEQTQTHIRIVSDPAQVTQEGTEITAERLNNIEDFLVFLDEMEEGTPNAFILDALARASMANREIQKHRRQGTQFGNTVLTNKGIVSGAVVSRSTTATRNINCSAGIGFERGRIFPIPEIIGGAAVPQNTGLTNAVCFAYLFFDANDNLRLDVTPLGGQIPLDAIPLFSITVPAGSTNESDQFLISCTFTSIRRIEAAFPVYLTAPPHVSVTLPFVMPDTNYHITLDIVSQDNTGFKTGDLYVMDRNINGFRIAYDGIGDNISINWQISKPDL